MQYTVGLLLGLEKPIYMHDFHRKRIKNKKQIIFFSPTHPGNRIKIAKGRVWPHLVNDLPGVPYSHGSFRNQQKFIHDVGPEDVWAKGRESSEAGFYHNPSCWLTSLFLFSLLWLVSVRIPKGCIEEELSKWSPYLDSSVNPTYPQMRLSKHSPQPWTATFSSALEPNPRIRPA